ncbi:MAG: sodium:solute symporter family transporter, partial [Planctomycetaceae bacterium]
MLFADASARFWLGLHLVDWIVLAAYFVVIMAIGVWSAKKVHDMADYFMGGRRFGTVFMMFFAFGSGTSSEQAVSVAAGSFRYGLAGIWYQFLWLWATPFYWIIAPMFRRMRALTTSDFFEARYDKSTATLYSLLGIAMSITFIAGGLYGAGEMIEGLAGGVNPETGRP